MPDDPATKHPAYERPSRVLGAPIAPKISMPEPPPPNSTRSLIPGTNIALPSEARIKVPISLGTLALVAFGSYSLANQRAIEREKIMDRVGQLETKIEANTRALEESRRECEREARSMSVIESKIAAAQSELVVINSRLKD